MGKESAWNSRDKFGGATIITSRRSEEVGDGRQAGGEEDDRGE